FPPREPMLSPRLASSLHP
ncbi:hypothetical protein D047_4393B, partial [Vibrio parahaemolyticus VPTS-2010_2]